MLALSIALLLVSLLAVVLLAKKFSLVVDVVTAMIGAPPAFAGVLVALLILLPEGISAVAAARNNDLQKSINLALGSSLATIGLTIPAVGVATYALDKELVLGLNGQGMVLLLLTFGLSMLTFGTGRTNILFGLVHMVVFAVFLFHGIRAVSRPKAWSAALSASSLFIVPCEARAATLDGAALTWPYALPFAGLLLSIAVWPLLFPKLWHAHYGKIAAAWSVLTLASLCWFGGVGVMIAAFVHAMLAEYLSFIVLLFSLYTVAGGVLVSGDIRGTPWNNAAILALGTVMASIVGTTGAAMILIRPLIRANFARQHNTHVFVFFIILVANVGGALSPLGDPPLFVGFLNGVDFFWTTRHLLPQTALVAGLLLAMFCAFDIWRYRAEPVSGHVEPRSPIRVRGLVNVPLIAAIIAAILLSANWRPGIAVDILGTRLELQNLIRDAALLLIALLSLWLTPDEHREANGFTWEPIREVAKLFAAIFTTIVPVLAALDAGRRGFFAWLLSAVTERDGTPHEVAYFWYTGLMSAFLDNAPTYLLFFKLAGGNAQALMGEFAGTLAAISMGAVFMGALTYIGNAPNLMVAAISIERGIKMPSFFGYLLWASVILVPMFMLLTLLPLAPVLR